MEYAELHKEVSQAYHEHGRIPELIKKNDSVLKHKLESNGTLMDVLNNIMWRGGQRNTADVISIISRNIDVITSAIPTIKPYQDMQALLLKRKADYEALKQDQYAKDILAYCKENKEKINRIQHLYLVVENKFNHGKKIVFLDKTKQDVGSICRTHFGCGANFGSSLGVKFELSYGVWMDMVRLDFYSSRDSRVMKPSSQDIIKSFVHHKTFWDFDLQLKVLEFLAKLQREHYRNGSASEFIAKGLRNGLEVSFEMVKQHYKGFHDPKKVPETEEEFKDFYETAQAKEVVRILKKI
jgi:hypothetical protein